jgi:gentisate 1,2-dioxygenase
MNPGDLLLTPGCHWNIDPTAEETFDFASSNRPALQALGMWRDEYLGSEV